MSDLVERLRHETMAAVESVRMCIEAADEIERLRAERDALRADAKRYQWLRDVDAPGKRYLVEWFGTPEQIDSNIDAVMKEHSK